MAFKLKLRPGNQYSFVSRLEPDFDHHFRVTVGSSMSMHSCVITRVEGIGN